MNNDQKQPPQVEALHQLLNEATTDEELNYLAEQETAIINERNEALHAMPKLGELAIQDGVVVEKSAVDAQREAGQQAAGPYNGNRRA